MIISLVAAVDKNNGIGYKGFLPWHIPDELKYFKKITLEKPVIMGRKTYLSLPKKPLPNRQNIVLTKDINFKAFGCEIAHSLKEALELSKNNKEIMIIGGLEIYKLFLPIANMIYLSKIKKEFICDTFFPKIDWSKWQLSKEEDHEEFISQIWELNLSY